MSQPTRQQQVDAVAVIIKQLKIEHKVNHYERYSYITIINDGSGIGSLPKEMLQIVIALPSFYGMNAGFIAGTFNLSFKDL